MAPSTVWAAWQPFENGYMGWRSDTDGVYILNFRGGGIVNAGQWQETPDEWRWPTTEPASAALSPPAGLFEPVRGFGWLWRTHLGGPDSQIGWATDNEKGFCVTIQSFEQGILFRSDTVEFCKDESFNWATHPSFTPLLFALYGDGTWRRY
jgi:hypothetical protein